MQEKTIIEIDCNLNLIDEDRFKAVIEAVFDIDQEKIEIYDSKFYAELSDFANTIADEVNEIKADDFRANIRD